MGIPQPDPPPDVLTRKDIFVGATPTIIPRNTFGAPTPPPMREAKEEDPVWVLLNTHWKMQPTTTYLLRGKNEPRPYVKPFKRYKKRKP